MAQIPSNDIKPGELERWYKVKAELDKLRAEEMVLRKRLFGAYFPDPKEGTNDFELGGGYVLKGGYKIERKIELPVFLAYKDKFTAAGIPVDAIVAYKPELALKEYRKLTDGQRTLFDACLEIKPGAPSMEIVMPKKVLKDQLVEDVSKLK